MQLIRVADWHNDRATRCAQCQRWAYDCCGLGAMAQGAFVCMWCAGLDKEELHVCDRGDTSSAGTSVVK